MSIFKTDYLQFGDNLYEVVPPAPTEVDRGGIIASPKTDADTIEARLGDDGKLYVENIETDLSNYYDKTAIEEHFALKSDLENYSWNDLNDKPVYEYTKDTRIISAKRFYMEEGDNDGFLMINAPQLTAGQTYYIVFDDVEYMCTARNWENQAILIGNGSLNGEGYGDMDIANGEPFGCARLNSGDFVIYTEATGQHSFALYTREIFEYIDEQHISDVIARTEYVDENFVRKSDLENIGSEYETKSDAIDKLEEAKAYTDDMVGAIPQTDWNQIDTTAIDYIKNKPFGKTISSEENVILEAIDVFVYKPGIWAWISENQFVLEEGKTYKVVFNGVEYECVAYSSIHGVVIGNLAPVGGSSGNNEPFCIRSQNLCTSAGGTYTVSISELQLQESIVTLSEEFIPDTIARTQYVDENLETAKSYTDDAIANLVGTAPESLDTIHELAAAFEENSDIVEILTGAIEGKADVGHVHDIYETVENATLKYEELVEIKADKEHVHSWNELNDKPFGDDSITYFEWDGDTTGLEYVETVDLETDGDITLRFYKCSDDVYTREEFLGSTITAITSEGEVSVEVTEEEITPMHPNMFGVGGAIMVANGNATIDDMTFTKGIWVSDPALGAYVKSITKQGGLKTLDEKYIPDTIARTTYVDEALSNKSDSTHNHDDVYETIANSEAKLDEAKAYTDTKTSDMATTTAVATAIDDKISAHNSSAEAHTDIRSSIDELSTKVNNFLDVDDETSDQLSEVLTMIENNKGTLDSITSNKVNVSDIVDNLTTSDASKVLSANQGVVIQETIDSLQEDVNSKFANLIFIGTYAEYQTAYNNGRIPINTFVILTDDGSSGGGSGDSGEDSSSTSSLLGTGVLGYMILG